MTFSGSWSPTFTESNSRNGMAETLFSLSVATTHKRGVGLLNHVAGLVRHDVLRHDHVSAEGLTNRVDVHVAVEAVAHLDRPHELQHLIDLNDIHVRDPDVRA